MMRIICPYCGAEAQKPSSAVNRALKDGHAIYCGRTCSALGRRRNKPKSQLVAEKAEYDRIYRERNRERLKAAKAEYYQRTIDRAKERELRRERMPRHVEYCRRPEYRKWKQSYDRKYRSRKLYGSFGEASIVLNELQTEILSRTSRIEISKANGTLNKHQSRRRDYERQTQRS